MHSDFDIIRRTIQYLDSQNNASPRVANVAGAIGRSPDQCKEIFSRWSGISPDLFLSHLACPPFKQAIARRKLIAEPKDIISLLRFRQINNMKVMLKVRKSHHSDRIQNLQYGFHETLFGRCLLGVSNHKLCWLSFTERNDEDSLNSLRAQWPNATLSSETIHTQQFANLMTHDAATQTNGLLVLQLYGTAFQLQVWRQLAGIPNGMFTTYGQVAKRLGKPQAARAVGNAIGVNPIAYFIPCHRVIRDTGEIGGYRWSTEIKRALLAREHAKHIAE